MNTDTIPESEFLLTELRYTVGQIHVQIGDMDRAARTNTFDGDRSPETILQELLHSEARYQQQYERILGTRTPDAMSALESAPLPLAGDDRETGSAPDFESERNRTLALLEHVGDEWPAELLDLVKAQVADDRQYATDLSECRKQFFEQPQRPDLDEPLISGEPHPEMLADKEMPSSPTSH